MRDDIDYYIGGPFAFGASKQPYESSRAVIYGVPLDATSSFKSGSRFGPNSIREASIAMEEPLKKAVHCDLGDMWVSPGNIAATIKRVSEFSEIIRNDKKVPIALGGEHTITVGSAKPFKDAVFIYFDAHADLRDEYLGDKLCHATACRRLLDFVPTQNILLVGVRSMCEEEDSFIKEQGIKLLHPGELDKAAKDIEKFTKGKDVYVSLDIDVLDSPYAPGTGTPEPGGFLFRQLSHLLGCVSGKIVGADVVETGRDAELITPTSAAKLVYQILSMI